MNNMRRLLQRQVSPSFSSSSSSSELISAIYPLALKDRNERLGSLKSLAHGLPVEHYATLRALMLHLHR